MKCHKLWSNLHLTQLFCCGIHQSSSIQVTNAIFLNNKDRLHVSHQFVSGMLQPGWKRRGICTVVPLQRILPACWGKWSFLSVALVRCLEYWVQVWTPQYTRNIDMLECIWEACSCPSSGLTPVNPGERKASHQLGNSSFCYREGTTYPEHQF